MERFFFNGGIFLRNYNNRISIMSFDVEKVRKDFPILSKTLEGGKKLVYLDSSATAQKPQCVIDAVADFYKDKNSNIHRSAHALSMAATQAYEDARKTLCDFFGAPKNFTGIFTRGTTESLNLVAACYGAANLKEGDEILLTQMEHHANIVPWQMIALRTGARVHAANILPDGSLDLEDFKSKLSPKTKIVSVAQASNVLGTVNPLGEISTLVRKYSPAVFSVDAAQSAPHYLASLRDFDCDFISISGHKCYGPTGIGMLIGKTELLDAMPPYQGGGDMIDSVSWEGTTFRPSPERFEAGTPNIAGAVGFARAVQYMESLDRNAARAHEEELLEFTTAELSKIDGLKIFGRAKGKLAIISFAVEGVHPHDISSLLNAGGIGIRTGHHCAEPLMKTLGVPSTCRASFTFYNTLEEAAYFAERLKHALDILR